MRDDPIVEKVRRIREEYATQFDYDLRAMADNLRIREQEHRDRLVTFPRKPTRRLDSHRQGRLGP
jgi:hypothetical protein